MTIDTSRLPSDRLASEVAHVLFLDIVAFSRGSMEEQARLTHDLRQVVRATPEYARAAERREMIGLDTGDGMALIFFRDPIAPVQCATEIARALADHPGLRLRMGIHSGPVSRVPDLNGQDNVTGTGINTAQRVMDCGDPGHILLSAASAEFVRDFEAWSSSLHDLGDAEVKHGLRLHLYNLVVGAVGNPAPPSRVAHTAPGEDTTPLRHGGKTKPLAQSEDALPVRSTPRFARYVRGDLRMLLALGVLALLAYVPVQHLFFAPRMKRGYTFGTSNLAEGGKPLYVSGKFVVGSHYTLTDQTDTLLDDGTILLDQRDKAHPDPNKGVIAIPKKVNDVRALLTVQRLSFLPLLSAILPKDQQMVEIGTITGPVAASVPEPLDGLFKPGQEVPVKVVGFNGAGTVLLDGVAHKAVGWTSDHVTIRVPDGVPGKQFVVALMPEGAAQAIAAGSITIGMNPAVPEPLDGLFKPGQEVPVKVVGFNGAGTVLLDGVAHKAVGWTSDHVTIRVPDGVPGKQFVVALMPEGASQAIPAGSITIAAPLVTTSGGGPGRVSGAQAGGGGGKSAGAGVSGRESHYTPHRPEPPTPGAHYIPPNSPR